MTPESLPKGNSKTLYILKMFSREYTLLLNSAVQDQTPPFKAASDIGLHYFQRRIYATLAVKGLR